MSRREIPFPDAAMALELVENGMSQQEAENITGVDRVTIGDIQRRRGHWLQDVERPVFNEWRQRTKREIMGRSSELAVKLLKHAEDAVTKNPEKTSPYQAIGMYGILRTHDRLDAGEPTDITVNYDVHAVVGLDRLGERLSQALLERSTKK